MNADRAAKRELNRLAQACRQLAVSQGRRDYDAVRDAVLAGSQDADTLALVAEVRRRAIEDAAVVAHGERQASVRATVTHDAARDAAGVCATTPAPAFEKQLSPSTATAFSTHSDNASPPAVVAAEAMRPAVPAANAGVRVEVAEVRGSDDASDIRWVMEHLADGEECLVGAPSLTARSLWRWANATAANNRSFVTDIYRTAFVSRAKEELEALGRRSMGEVGRAIEACLAVRQRIEAEMREPVLPPS